MLVDSWADYHYIPREYWDDWIFFATIFEAYNVHHEMGVATIVDYIDQQHQVHPTVSIVDSLAGCWGHCCAYHPTKLDIERYRCGHHLDYEDEKIWPTFYELLEEQKDMLGNRWDAAPRKLAVNTSSIVV